MFTATHNFKLGYTAPETAARPDRWTDWPPAVLTFFVAPDRSPRPLGAVAWLLSMFELPPHPARNAVVKSLVLARTITLVGATPRSWPAAGTTSVWGSPSAVSSTILARASPGPVPQHQLGRYAHTASMSNRKKPFYRDTRLSQPDDQQPMGPEGLTYLRSAGSLWQRHPAGRPTTGAARK